MTGGVGALVRGPYVVFAGWTLFLILWETTIVGLIFAAWRVLRGTRPAAQEYNAGLVALLAAILLAVALPIALGAWPEARPSSSAAVQSPSTLPAPAVVGAGAVPRIAARAVPATLALLIPYDVIAGVAAIVWLTGVVVLAGRLAGGWFVAQRLVRRARSIEDAGVMQAAANAAVQAGVAAPALLASQDVEAPVVLRWRAPVLLVPHAALPRLDADQMSALLLHEFAHIRRCDYLVNLLQSMIELLLFFSPAIVWMSRRVREAREFCCDDAAVAQCGNRVVYVEALTTLAALDTTNATRLAIGVSGPRLITRVRRLLQEDSMMRFSSARVAALGLALVVLVVTGIQLSAASALRMPWRTGAAGSAQQARVPYGYAAAQDGSGIEVKGVVFAEDGSFRTATLRNISTEPLASVRVVVAVQRMRSAGGWLPVRFFVSDELPLSLAPGATASVTADVLSSGQIDAVARESGGARLQVFFGLQSATFANGYVWNTTPNPDAKDGSEALNIARAVYPRSLIERDAARPATGRSYCEDDRGRQTSLGGAVPILNEPGHLMECVDGRWVDKPWR